MLTFFNPKKPLLLQIDSSKCFTSRWLAYWICIESIFLRKAMGTDTCRFFTIWMIWLVHLWLNGIYIYDHNPLKSILSKLLSDAPKHLLILMAYIDEAASIWQSLNSSRETNLSLPMLWAGLIFLILLRRKFANLFEDIPDAWICEVKEVTVMNVANRLYLVLISSLSHIYNEHLELVELL